MKNTLRKDASAPIRASIFQGDCLSVLKSFPAAYVDSMVTDPPAGISFMGKSWDGDKGGRDAWVAWLSGVMTEAMRVLKPGGHALVWAIPRTSHWTATALENAGFEVRDIITHLFGSGFPKSMDLSKAIDKAAGAQRAVVGVKVYAGGHVQNSNGTDLGRMNDDAWKPTSGRTETAPATDAAKQWEGFGTALKPASEHWILCRKPLSEKTVAANVLKHGTGGLNIDACRIATIEDRSRPPRTPNAIYGGGKGTNSEASESHVAGRFPANLVLSHNDDCDDACTDGCAVAELDRQSGDLGKSSGGNSKNVGNKVYGKFASELDKKPCGFGDSGGASRFFYVAKASRRDKGDGNTHPTVKSTKLMEYLIRLVTPPGGTVLDPFMGSGSTGVAAIGLGSHFVGVEREAEYLAIAKGRLKVAGAKVIVGASE